MQNSTQAILFDLDGTLLDTGRDMGGALNRVLEEMGRPAVDYDRIRPVVSQGTAGLFEMSLGVTSADPAYEALRGKFLDYYERDICSHTTLFAGMEDVLARLDRRELPWGVVTSKPEYLAVSLLDSLELLTRAACVVGGDTLEKRKPHPAPLLHGCALADLKPETCIYVGDAESDIVAGRRAGMKTLIASFGYLSAADRPEDWGADGIIDHPLDILEWI